MSNYCVYSSSPDSCTKRFCGTMEECEQWITANKHRFPGYVTLRIQPDDESARWERDFDINSGNSIYDQMNKIDDSESLDESCNVQLDEHLKVMCKELDETGNICGYEQELPYDCLCVRCNSSLINSFIDTITDVDGPCKLIFNGNIVSKSTSPSSGKGAPVAHVVKEFFDMLTCTIHDKTAPRSTLGAFDINELNEPLKTILFSLKGMAEEELNIQLSDTTD